MSGAVQHAERAHAELGASSADRWMACPGSVRLSRDTPNVDTPYTRQGTAAHELAETALRKGVDPEVYLGASFNGVEVDEDMVEAVRAFVRHVRERQQQLGAELTIEQRFTLAPLNPPAPMFGTADVVLRTPTHLEVIDYKHGLGYAVSAKGNGQLRYYALGALLTLSPADAARLETLTITIVQPRAAHAEGTIRSEHLPIEALLDWSGDLMAAAQLTLRPDAPLAAGSHCRFCRAQARCPAQLEEAQALARVEFSETASMPPAPEVLTDAELRAILQKAPVIEGWLKSVRDFVQDRLVAGGQFDGYKLVQKRATRRWRDEAEAQAWLAEAGVTPDEAFNRTLKSVAQIEKVVGKKALPAELVVKESSGVTLAPEFDPREAIAPGHEFEALPPSDTTAATE